MPLLIRLAVCAAALVLGLHQGAVLLGLLPLVFFGGEDWGRWLVQRQAQALLVAALESIQARRRGGPPPKS